MTVFNAALAAGAALLGDLRDQFDWQIIFLIFSVMVFSPIFLLKYLKLNTHLEQVAQLERSYLEKNWETLNTSITGQELLSSNQEKGIINPL
jgi:hypothetical protein